MSCVGRVTGTPLSAICNKVQSFLVDYVLDVELQAKLAHSIVTTCLLDSSLFTIISESEALSAVDGTNGSAVNDVKTVSMVYPTAKAQLDLSNIVGLIGVHFPHLVVPRIDHKTFVHKSHINVGSTLVNDLTRKSAEKLCSVPFVINQEALQ